MWPGLTMLILDCVWANHVCLASIGASYSLKYSLALLHVTQYRGKPMLQYDDPISGLRINFLTLLLQFQHSLLQLISSVYMWEYLMCRNACTIHMSTYRCMLYTVNFSFSCTTSVWHAPINLDTKQTTYGHKLVDLQTTLHQLHKCECWFH